uniref:Complement inhibitor RaCI4 n=1 Tax=Hyalomma rufipes TaxID=72862 RepID=C5I4_HYARU|nr:RecName: Full=Complement inhibitor RaCI4; Flags: Precursor [Hyalomma rufipes]DAA64996.1 TPA_exp: complement inhibitor RaCI4 precursor [Hyalomma rufipes]
MSAFNIFALVVVVCALMINECCTSQEPTTPLKAASQCSNVKCRRRFDHLGNSVTEGCPSGCLCVYQATGYNQEANGTCYELMKTSTTTTTEGTPAQ